ncbi:MAG: 4-(cytidine 5'-diphospho)-2-C-methyl-D-erythritol kinase [Pseudomonadota bacterium]
MTQVFSAPAKLNLMLRIVGRRFDGYHLLETVFRFIDYADEVCIAVRADGEIRRSADLPGVPPESDLTLRAARLLKHATGSRLGADIELLKRVPMGAGLGGGSSDAATVLLALNHLWGTALLRSELQALALTLGADVPVFVFGESAFAQGIGELLEPIALPPAWYVVLTPAVSVATAEIFSDPGLKRDSKPLKIHGFSAEGYAADAANDMQSLVCRCYPEVARHLEWLKQHGPALMTGSGSAVFATFDSEPAARAVLNQMPATMSGFVARGLDKHPLWGMV